MNVVNRDQKTKLKAALDVLPKCELAVLPTPLDRCDRLTENLGGPQIWFKRDDLTGLALGGNKTRMFEYVLGDAVERGIGTVVAGAAVQSNYCRQLAASCAKLGLQCHLVIRKVRGEKNQEIQGGLLIDLMIGAHVAQGLRIDQLWLCSSDTTQSGIVFALTYVESPIRLVGLPALTDPVSPGWTFPECLSQTANVCGKLLGLGSCVEPGDIISMTNYVGSGYSILTDEAREATELVGSLEGILLDPIYTSKAMAGLIDYVRKSLVPTNQNVVILHTGGLPALFTYSDTLGLEKRIN